MTRTVAAWWGQLPVPVRAQVARFGRVALLTIVPQLLAAAADPRGLTAKVVAGVATAGLEAGWRAITPPPETKPAS